LREARVEFAPLWVHDEGMLTWANLLLLAVTLASGQKTQSENDRKPDTWEKMKDCAAQAERIKLFVAEVVAELALGVERDAAAGAGTHENYGLHYSAVELDAAALAHWEATHDGYVNHYSPKYDRCYVRISSIIQKAGRVSDLGIRLIDAFEYNTVAVFKATVPASKNLCLADDTVVDCQVARDFISDHMRN
jgi:hypothetical protein